MYLIAAANLDFVQTKIQKLNRKADKLNLPPIEIKIVETVEKEISDDVIGHTYNAKFFRVNVTGVWPKLNGWKMISAIEPIEKNGPNLVKEVPGETCPEQFRDTNMTCEHCGTNRYRKKVFILQNEQGEYKQVGRNCLADFINTSDIEGFMKASEQFFEVETLLRNAGERLPHIEYTVDLEKFMLVTSAIINSIGWIPASASNGRRITADWVWMICNNFIKNEDQKVLNETGYKITPKDYETVTNAIQWILNENDVTSNYIYDLKTIVEFGTINLKTYRFAASLISAYHKHLGKQIVATSTQKPSEYVGNIGERLELQNVKVVSMIDIQGFYPKTLVKFLQDSGNQIVWFASADSKILNELEIDQIVNIKATIHKFSEFQGIKQTIVQRVTFDKEGN